MSSISELLPTIPESPAHQRQKPLKCPNCPELYNFEKNLELHLLTHGTSTTCPQCGQTFHRASSFRGHIKSHQDDDEFNCEWCSSSFSFRVNLAAHLEKEHKSPLGEEIEALLATKRKTVIVSRHKKSDKYPCKTCNKRFAKRSLLLRHENGHSNMKPFECTECHQKFTQKSSLDRHGRVHSGEKSYKCPKCPMSFSQKSNLINHVGRVHTSEKDAEHKYPCSHCSCVFHKLNSLNRHVTMVHPNRVEEVETIENNSIDDLMQQLKRLERRPIEESTVQAQPVEAATISIEQPKLIKHILKNNEKYFECSFCQKLFRKSHDVIRHIRIHTKERPFQCEICDCQFALKSTLDNHKLIHEKLKSSTEISNLYQCEVCLQKFSSMRKMDTHVRQHSDHRQYCCSTCQKTFHTSSSLSGHMRSHVPKQLEIENLKKMLPPPIEIGNEIVTEENYDERLYQCSLCGLKMKKLSHLKQHELTHQDLKSFQCDICLKQFTRKSSLNLHLKIHLSEKSLSCHICNAKFLTNGSLKRHMSVHSDERSFGCTYCSATFKTRDNCKAHIETHLKDILDPAPIILKTQFINIEEAQLDNITVVKWTKDESEEEIEIPPTTKLAKQCHICPKSFQKPSDLNRHMRVHTKEKPYKCDQCAKAFAIKSTLDDHLKTHSASRNGCSCPVCGKSYASSKVLKIHLRLHTGEMPFQCEICSKSFRTSGHKIAHMNSHRYVSDSGNG